MARPRNLESRAADDDSQEITKWKKIGTPPPLKQRML